jgi:hypothetical protein
MSRGLTGLTVAAALVLSAVSALAQELPRCRLRPVNVEHANYVPQSESAVGFICAQGSPARVHLEVHLTTIDAVLSALRAAYHISYGSSVALDETRDGTYAGSLRRVISRLLDGYDYVIKQQNTALEVDIFGKNGAQAVPAPIRAEPRAAHARPEARVSRNR